MPQIPQNNLKERLIKLGYNTIGVNITPPALDNSKVVAKPKKVESCQVKQESIKQETLITPRINNIDEWSDFEDE